MTKKTQKKLRKALLLISCAALLVCITVGVTVAYLTDNDTVTNTFSVGKLGMYMDETDVDEYGVAKTPAARDKDNSYKIVPGHTYIKDPTIWYAYDDEADEVVNSEAAWLFVEVKNELADIEATDYTKVDAQIKANSWAVLSTEGDTTIYYKAQDAATAKTEVKVFANFKVSGTVENASNFEGKQIIVKAYAVQKDGFNETGKSDLENATAAWNATFGE